jgi:uncharacterized protein YdgA (DUF945 family)
MMLEVIMHKSAKIVALLLMIIIGIGVFSPFLAGFYIQKNYNSVLTFYNSLPGIHTVSTHYKRNWFSSDATITVEINNNDYLSVLEWLGINKQNIPRHYTIEQHIQHGPVLYKNNTEIPFRFGLAIITNKLRATPDLQIIFERLGIDDRFLQNSAEYISFGGHCFYHLKLSTIHLSYPGMDTLFKVGGLESHLWLDPKNFNLSGDVVLQSILAENRSDFISIPDLKYEFHVQPSQDGLWIGTSLLTLSRLTATEGGLFNTIFSNIRYHSDADIIAGKFSSSRKIDIEKLEFNDQAVGPFHFQGGINQINAQALDNLFSAYHIIMERGELYPTQLEKKMIFLLPALINSGSSIQLKRFELNTPHGKLQISGELQWNMNDTSIPNDLSELLRAANAKLNLRVSKLLVDDLIEFYLMSPLINDDVFYIDEEEANILSENIYYNMQNNSLLIDAIVNNGQLREIDAVDLLKLQKEMVPIQDYANQIRSILWDKYLTLETSYLLYWGYVGVEQSLLAIEKKIQDNQEKLKSDIKGQLNALVKKGYLIENKNEYTTFIKQENGKITFNGK